MDGRWLAVIPEVPGRKEPWLDTGGSGYRSGCPCLDYPEKRTGRDLDSEPQSLLPCEADIV
jgi:hypothetical protein